MRRCWQVVLLTSAVWFFLDVFVLLFLLDVRTPPAVRDEQKKTAENPSEERQFKEKPSNVVMPTMEKSIDEGLLAKLMRG